MDFSGIMKIVANIVGAAAAGYTATGLWEGAAAAAAAALAALFQKPPWRT